MATTTQSIRVHLAVCILAAALMAGNTAAMAAAGHGKTSSIGEPGTKANVTRTVTITVRDNYYEPEAIEVKKGETIRFIVKNTGELLHEFNIGTSGMHAEHQKEMMQMAEHGMLTATGINHQMMNMDHGKAGLPSMKHDDPNSVLVEPGKSAELVWKFSKDATLEFACNLPGHYEAGMVGHFKFQN